MKTKKSLEGYLLIDHTMSPGTPAVPEGTIFEMATMQCCHCQAEVIPNPLRQRPRNYCAKCDRYVCDTPACIAECNNFDKVLDLLQEQAFRNLNIQEF